MKEKGIKSSSIGAHSLLAALSLAVCLFLGGAIGAAAPITHPKTRQGEQPGSFPHQPSIKEISFLLINGWAAGSANSNQINSSFLILKEKRRLINWFEFRRYISASSTASSHQSTKYLFDFDLRLFPQHRYTYCYNIFLIHPIQSTSSWMESIKNKSSFFCFWLMEWEREVDCWLPPSLKNFILQITE